MDPISLIIPKSGHSHLQQKVSKKSSKKTEENTERIRATKACDQCSLKRSKCSGEADGCWKCGELGISCSYTRIVKKRGPAKKTSAEKATANGLQNNPSSSPTDSVSSFSFASRDSTLVSSQHLPPPLHTDSALPSPVLSTELTTSLPVCFDKLFGSQETAHMHGLYSGFNDQLVAAPLQILQHAAIDPYSKTTFDTISNYPSSTTAAAAAASMALPFSMGAGWDYDHLFLDMISNSGPTPASIPWSADQSRVYNQNRDAFTAASALWPKM